MRYPVNAGLRHSGRTECDYEARRKYNRVVQAARHFAHNLPRLEEKEARPNPIYIGRKGIITVRADEAWERREARYAQSAAARREAERRSAQASMAGKISAKSPLHISNLNRKVER